MRADIKILYNREGGREKSNSMEKISEATRFKFLLSKDPVVTGIIKKPNGSWKESNRDTLDLVMR